MAKPYVIVAATGLSVRDEIVEAIAGSPPGADVDAAPDRATLFAHAHARHPTLVILGVDFVDDILELVREIGERVRPQPRIIVIFESVDDMRRESVAVLGANEFVRTRTGNIQPLLAQAARMISRELLAEKLSETTAQFTALVENSNDGIYILKGSRFAYANARFCDMVGFRHDELMADDFSITEQIIAPESQPALEARRRRIEAGLAVAPRYEFRAQRADKTRFDAQVSTSYIAFDGEAASLGIMEDITERKLFEQQLVRKNRELAMLNQLASSINEALALDEVLRLGCRNVHELLRTGATGIALLDPVQRKIRLVAHEGIDAGLVEVLDDIDAGGETLLAKAIAAGKTYTVTDLQHDPRVAVEALASQTHFVGAVVVPVRARDKILGAAFVLTTPGHDFTEEDHDLLSSMGVLLGNALEKARLRERELTTLSRQKAISEIALAIDASLEIEEVTETIARKLSSTFGPERVVIARHDPEARRFVPVCVLDEGEVIRNCPPVSENDTILQLALQSACPVQCSHGSTDDRDVPRHTRVLFERGLRTVVGLPILRESVVVGGILLAYRSDEPRPDDEIEALKTLTTHVAIAIKNAELFRARNHALRELKEAQHELVQSEKLRALGELAAGVAHDFNNILGAILGRAQLLKAQLRDPMFVKHAVVIEKAAIDGAETVRRIQEIGRQEPREDDLAPISVREILEDVIDLTEPRWRDHAQETGRTISVTVDIIDDNLQVRGNPHELREVLINLVHNAVDAMVGDGTIVLRGERCGAHCHISVQDDGQGIPPDVRDRIFDPFFTTKGDAGTGLGLSVSYSIVRRHGGTLTVDSRSDADDHGTTFTLRLPDCVDVPEPTGDTVDESDDDLTERTQSHEAPEVGDRGTEATEVDPFAQPTTNPPLDSPRGRVLVVDDEENIRDILTDILESGGYQVETAPDGASALAQLEDGPVDLVLTDLGLPGMNGWEVAAAVKASYPHTPVGLVTGWGSSLEREHVEARGVDLVLNKPFRFDQVLHLVETALGARAAPAFVSPPDTG